MNLKSQKGSITLFVLIALLFYMAFLLLLYANNLNKIQTITEKIDYVKSIYSSNTENIDEVYNRYKGIQIGDYVNYNELSNGKKTYSIDYTQNGGTSSANSQTLETEDLGWRVLDIAEDGQITLISDNSTETTLYLRGENGYLNGENILNTTCNELYGKGVGAESARSLNVDDVNKAHNYIPSFSVKYQYQFVEGGTCMQYRNSNDGGNTWSDWADITKYASATNNLRMPGEEETISSTKPGVSEEFYQTYYRYNLGITELEKIISYKSDGAAINSWLSSKCIKLLSYRMIFSLFRINGNMLTCAINSDYDLYCTVVRDTEYRSFAIRPVVTLNSNVTLVKDTATDTWNIQ